MLCMKLSCDRDEGGVPIVIRGDSGSSGMVEEDNQEFPNTSLLWLKLPPMFRLDDRDRLSAEDSESLLRALDAVP